MLSRLLPRPSNFRRLTLLSSKLNLSPQPHFPQNPNFFPLPRFFSSNNDGNSNDGKFDKSTWTSWNLSSESGGKFDKFFTEESGDHAGISTAGEEDEPWLKAGEEKTSAKDEWTTADGYKPWSLAEEDKEDVFGLQEEVVPEADETGAESSLDSITDSDRAEKERKDELMRLEQEEQELTAVLEGSSHAFGDLMAASGITDEMLDSLIALKDFEGIEGLPPLSEIEEIRYEKNTKKVTRAEIERQKQEEDAKARVRQVDDKGRSYGTGRRKCSIARVFIQPGHGNFVINDKQFDVYFPMLDHRAALLRPFTETQTLGFWDVDCTVKGGGTSGQVGAIRLGISRALQNWIPELRAKLKPAGFLTRDPRVVERKKPGKAKARKSFQWVKR